MVSNYLYKIYVTGVDEVDYDGDFSSKEEAIKHIYELAYNCEYYGHVIHIFKENDKSKYEYTGENINIFKCGSCCIEDFFIKEVHQKVMKEYPETTTLDLFNETCIQYTNEIKKMKKNYKKEFTDKMKNKEFLRKLDENELIKSKLFEKNQDEMITKYQEKIKELTK